jgi:hypothetical protein
MIIVLIKHESDTTCHIYRLAKGWIQLWGDVTRDCKEEIRQEILDFYCDKIEFSLSLSIYGEWKRKEFSKEITEQILVILVIVL